VSESVLLRVDGEVDSPTDFTLDDLAALTSEHQVADMSQIDPKRQGQAVTLEAILECVALRGSATHLGLHASLDDFHASIPLEAVRQRAYVIYANDGSVLTTAAGGPVRFYIHDHSACHVSEIDECANVKFLDRIELTIGRGHDNRPQDDTQHADLHRRQES